MSGYSILYLGRGEAASEFLEVLKQSPVCERLQRSDTHDVAITEADEVDLVLFEAGPGIAQSGQTLEGFVRSRARFPLVAVATADQEHRCVAAQKAGAQAYLLAEDLDPQSIARVVDHAVSRHRLMANLSEADNTVLSILNSINDGVIVVDREGRPLDINPAGRSILGLSPREIPDDRWAASFGATVADGETAIASAELPLARAGRGEKFNGSLCRHPLPDTGEVTLNVNGQGLFNGSSKRIGGVVTFRDVSEVVDRRVKLEKFAQYDELTSLPNRRLFLHQLEKAVGRAQRGDTPLGVLLIDLDQFRHINETLGHDTGDALLAEVATRLNRNLRIGDFTGRWGADEFVVCVEDIDDAHDAGSVAQKIVLFLSEKYTPNGAEVFVTPSIGIAVYPDSGETAELLVKSAKLAMQQARQRGGGRFQYYSAALNRKMQQREELELGLRHALVRKEFVLHYQPRVDVASGRLIGFEALLRWNHPRFGLLPPARFQSILESSGLIHSAGEWAVRTALSQLVTWQHQFELPDLSLAVKLSQQQLSAGRIVETIRDALSDTMLDPGCVEFEISDGVVVRQRSRELEILKGLRKLGVRLSIDHFGTTDVSLNALDTGVIDSFVLDQSLIQDIEENDSHQRIVRAAIAMARGLDIEVAADGVETMHQYEYLKSCQCDLVQGYLISRPVNADKIPQLLRSEIAGTRLLQRGMP